MARSPARSEKRQRAAVRRERRGGSPAPRPVSTAASSPWPVPPLTLLWAGATIVLIGLMAISLRQKITWYLAVDQYGYLAFAHDLIRGHIFHHWPPLDIFKSVLPDRVDVLSQTYVWDNGRLYCRYAPGFPLLMAPWLLLFGDDGLHYLNPTIYITLLVVLLISQLRLFGSRWRATVGVALLILCPTQLYLWGTTLTRDLAAHLFGIFGLFLLLPNGRPLGARRMLAAGLALGFTGSIRPDCVLYLIPAGVIALLRLQRAHWRGLRQAIPAASLGVFLGLVPFLGYNWIATGNPFRATQGMELQSFLGDEEEAAVAPTTPPTTPPAQSQPKVGYPPGAWIGGAYDAVQGGGLKLSNLPKVLPLNFGLLRSGYGDVLLGVAGLGAILALFQRRLLFAFTVPYCVLALLFYSCWTRHDGRYLSGIFCLLPLLMVEGLFGPFDLIRRLVRGRQRDQAWWVAAALAVAGAIVAGALVVAPPKRVTILQTLVPLLAFAISVTAGAALQWPHRRITRFAVPVIALVLVALSVQRYSEASQMRAAFQQPQMLRARATFAKAVQPNAVVITTEEIGRPGENIDYYSGVAHAFYITDLMRWRVTVLKASSMLIDAGKVPYLLLPPTQPGLAEMIKLLRNVFDVELIARIPKTQAMDYFVAAPFHRGIELELYRIKQKTAAAG